MNQFIVIFIFCGIFLLPISISAAEIFPNKNIKIIYLNTCAECYGRKAKGGGDAPRLRSNDFLRKYDVGTINEMILKGVPKEKSRYPGKYEGGMPPTKNITEKEVKKLSELIKKWNQ